MLQMNSEKPNRTKLLKQWRQALGYTQKDLAAILGVSNFHICDLERNRGSDNRAHDQSSGTNLRDQFTATRCSSVCAARSDSATKCAASSSAGNEVGEGQVA
jgi:DNA-binding XRE family transcriptional regulator